MSTLGTVPQVLWRSGHHSRYCWRSGHQQQDVDVEVYWYEELCAVSGVMQHVLCV